MKLAIRPGNQEQQCPLCRELCQVDTGVCSGCRTAYHPECLLELGGCAVLGCAEAERFHAAPRAGALRPPCEGSPSRQPCAVCDEAFEGFSRRLCHCGSPIHQACLPDHAKTCERASGLLAAPTTQPRERQIDRSTPAGDQDHSVIVMGFGVMFLSFGLLALITYALDPLAGNTHLVAAVAFGLFGATTFQIGRTAG